MLKPGLYVEHVWGKEIEVEWKYDASKYCQFNDSNLQVLPTNQADLIHGINKNAEDGIGCMGLWQYKLDFPHQKMVSIEIGQPTPLRNLTSYFCYSQVKTWAVLSLCYTKVHCLGFLTWFSSTKAWTDAFHPDRELLKMRVCLQTSKTWKSINQWIEEYINHRFMSL